MQSSLHCRVALLSFSFPFKGTKVRFCLLHRVLVATTLCPVSDTCSE